jgi:hypothetical protein
MTRRSMGPEFDFLAQQSEKYQTTSLTPQPTDELSGESTTKAETTFRRSGDGESANSSSQSSDDILKETPLDSDKLFTTLGDLVDHPLRKEPIEVTSVQ